MKKQVLIVYLHGIGDHLMATSAIREYKRQHPDTEISLLALNHPACAEIWTNNPDIKRVLFSSLNRNPRYGSPLFWLRDYWRILADINRVQKRYGFAHVYNIVHFYMPGKIYPYLPFSRYRRHKSEIVAKQLGVVLQQKTYVFHLPHHVKQLARTFFARHHLLRKKIVGLHYTASTQNKSLSSLQVRMILSELLTKKCHVLILSHLPEPSWLHYVRGVTWYQSHSLLKTAALLERCHHFIGVDSGIAHLAAAVGTPSLVLYMNTAWIDNSAALGKHVRHYDFSRKDVARLLLEIKKFLLLS